VPWQGEKEAIRYLMSHDPAYLEMFQRCLVETDRERKVELYEKVAALTLAPPGTLWSYDATAIELRTEGDIQQTCCKQHLPGGKIWFLHINRTK